MKINFDFLKKNKQLVYTITGLGLLLIIAVGFWYFVLRDQKVEPDQKVENSVLETINQNTSQNENAREILAGPEVDGKSFIDELSSGDTSVSVIAIFPDQLKRHNTINNCYLVFDNEVYDVSTWQYPGQTPIDDICGTTKAAAHFAKDQQEKPPVKYFVGHYIIDLEDYAVPVE